MKKLLIFKSLFTCLLLFCFSSSYLRAANETSEAARATKGPKLSLEEKRTMYEDEREAFRNAQREWVLAHLDANSTSEDAALLKAQFIRDNFEWRMLVGERKFDFKHGQGQAKGREVKPVKAAMKEIVKETVKQMRADANAKVSKDWRDWRELKVYEKAAREIIELESGAEAVVLVEEAAEE